MKEVVIIGGGVIGLCTAWFLRQEGMQVTIIDKGDFSDGCSFGNAGMIVPSHFTPLASPGMIAKGLGWMFAKNSPFFIRPRLSGELMQWLWLFYKSSTKKHVTECAPLLRDWHEESREMYAYWNQLPDFSFDFERKGILMLFQSAAAEKEEMEVATKAHGLGMEAVFVSPGKLKELEPGIAMNVRGAIHYPGDAHLSPDLFMTQMKGWLESNGVEFVPQLEVERLNDLGKEGCQLLCNRGKILQAQHVVVATGAWAGKMMKSSGYTLPMQDGKGYSFTIQQPEHSPQIPALLHEARVAITPMGSRLRISGTLEISGMDEIIRAHKVKSIVEAVPRYYHQLNIEPPEKVWFGYRPCSPDGMPYVGRLKENSSVIVAAGHSMMGLSLAPATGRMIKDCLVGSSTPSRLLYPLRY